MVSVGSCTVSDWTLEDWSKALIYVSDTTVVRTRAHPFLSRPGLVESSRALVAAGRRRPLILCERHSRQILRDLLFLISRMKVRSSSRNRTASSIDRTSLRRTLPTMDCH